jgi:ASC-1-like (ASCH) protein
MIIPDKVIASNKALEAASIGSIDSNDSKNPEPKQQGGISKRKKSVPKIKRGFKMLKERIKTAQRKVDKKSNITIFPHKGRKRRAPEKIRAVRPYTQISAAAQIMAEESLLDAIIIKPDPIKEERGEWEPQRR